MAKVDAKQKTDIMILEDLEISTKPLQQKEAFQEDASKHLEQSVPTASNMWSEFVGGVSLHGIRFVYLQRPLWARIGWLIVLVAFSAYFLYTATRSVTKYLNYPINTVITQKYVSELEFPAISICPLNLVSKKKLFALDGDATFVKYGLNDRVCEVTAPIRGAISCGLAMVCCCLDLLFFDVSTLLPICTNQFKQELIKAQTDAGVYFNASNFFLQYGQNIEEMLGPRFCVFNTDVLHPCNTGNFTASVTDFGSCQTFNAGLEGPDSVRKVTVSGPGGGLNLLLDAKVDDHVIGRLSEGFSVIIHNQGEFFTSWDGINVGPGTLATITLHQQRIKNLEAPHETMCQEKQLKTYRTYTIAGCLYECVMENVLKNCKCRGTGYLVDSSVRTCRSSDQACVLQETLQHNIQTDCDCPVPCNEIRYTTEVSYSKFPDVGTAQVVILSGFASSLDQIIKNSVFLQIGYRGLNYELHEQEEAFGIEALLGEIGGNLGLFLGCSLMTVFEFADFLIALIYVRKLQKNYPL